MDFKHRSIPDDSTLWVALFGVVSRVAQDGWWSWISLIVAVAVIMPLGFLSRRDIVGGGDAKLIAATTLLFKPILVPELILAISLAGGLLSLSYIIFAQVLEPAFGGVGGYRQVHREASPGANDGKSDERGGLLGSEEEQGKTKGPLPYALAILAGAAFILLREVFRFLPAISF